MADHVSERASEKASETFNYPFAAAPDIIRAHQKDAYFEGILLNHLSNLLRHLYGARFLHTYTSEARTFSELLYLGLTTFLGNRTLGEEYCDIVQIEDDSLKLPEIGRRAGYILTSILLPYGLGRILPGFRSRIRAKLESNLRKGNAHWIQSYLLEHLSTITSPSPLHALTLTVFYFSGAYYQLSKRIWGLRYIFTKKIAPSEARVGYEVLGVLLLLQMSVQTWLHLRNTLTANSPVESVEISTPNELESVTNVGKATHTEVLNKPRYDLSEKEVMPWIKDRKCTLCLEELKDPSAVACGHVFCWACIGDWVREKPECPLCRREASMQHILPLRG